MAAAAAGVYGLVFRYSGNVKTSKCNVAGTYITDIYDNVCRLSSLQRETSH